MKPSYLFHIWQQCNFLRIQIGKYLISLIVYLHQCTNYYLYSIAMYNITYITDSILIDCIWLTPIDSARSNRRLFIFHLCSWTNSLQASRTIKECFAAKPYRSLLVQRFTLQAFFGLPPESHLQHWRTLKWWWRKPCKKLMKAVMLYPFWNLFVDYSED